MSEAKLDDKAAQEFFKRLQKKTKDVQAAERKWVNIISVVVFRDIIKHFEEEKGPEGKWAPWAASYRKQLERRGFSGNKLLQFNGRLRNSFTPEKWRKTNAGPEWYNPAQTKSGFPYAAHHDDGPSDGSKPRKFMWLSDGALDDISKITLAYVLGGK